MDENDQIPKLLSEGVRQHNSGELDAAETTYKQALKSQPNNSIALHLCGVLHLDQGRHCDAADVLERAVALDPLHTDAHLTLGDAYLEQGEWDKAGAEYTEALRLAPHHFDAEFGLAIVLQRQNHHGQAISLFQQIIQREPQDPIAHHNLALSLAITGEQVEAIRHYQAVLKIDPAFLESLLNLSKLYLESAEYEKAAAVALDGIKVQPNSSSLRVNLAQAYLSLNDTDHALEQYRLVAELEPSSTAALNKVGVLLKEKGQVTEALQCFKRCLQRDTSCAVSYRNYFQTCRDVCDWTDYNARLAQFMQRSRSCIDSGVMPPVAPFFALSLPFTETELLKIGRIYGDQWKVTTDNQLCVKRSKPLGRIKIGYLSANFHNHPGNHLISGLFALHDREQFEVYAYSFGGNDESEYRKKVVDGVDHFIDITSMDDRSAAERIAKDEIDILIDVKGYTKPHRPQILWYRPAKVQINYLGYAGTSGISCHDYILADKIVIPKTSQQYYSESVLYLPNQYQVNDLEQEIAGDEVTRAQHCLPDKGIVFCCFNQSYKIEPIMFDVWMKIINRIEGSVLWLMADSIEVQANLRIEAEKRGVAPERLVFASRVSRPHHLNRHQLADLFLDTFTYNAHTTASDALRMGVPVITTPADTFAGRVCSSLLHAVGLPQLITSSLKAYEDLAVHLAHNRDARQLLHDHLADNALHSPLFDTQQFARDLEEIFRSVMQ